MSATLTTIPARFDGKQIQLDVPYPLEPDTPLLVTVLEKQPVDTSNRLMAIEDLLSLRGVFAEDNGFDNAIEYLEKVWRSWNPPDSA